MKWNALVLVVLAALVAPAGSTGRADAASGAGADAAATGGSYHIVADGDPIIGWGPDSGAINLTSDDKVSASGTLVGDYGSAPYSLAAGPGIVRAALSGTFAGPAGFSNPFGQGTQAVSTTELTISGPQTDLNISLNLHVDGFLDTTVCGSGTSCGALEIETRTAPFGRQADFLTLPETRANSLGLAIDAVPGGFHVHGDVIGTAFGMRTNTPTPITLELSLSSRFGAGPDPSTFGGDFDDPLRQLQVSFDPAKPVLNDVPAGFTVSGPSVVDNHWTNPFDDVDVTSCAMLSQPTVVIGNLTIHHLAGCPVVSLPNLTSVGGDLVIDGVDGSPTEIGPGVSVGGVVDVSGTGGDLTIEDNTVGEAIDVSGTGGDLTIDGNTVGGPIDVSGAVGGDLTVVDNGNVVVNAGAGQVGGDATIESAGDPFSATTADGSTSVTILDALATMHARLPDGTFDSPVAFTIARTPDGPPEAGTAPGGAPAQIDPIVGYHFAFAVPTLGADAQLTFTVDLAQLDAVGRAELLDAIAHGDGTIAVKGDAPDSALHAFAQCQGAHVPTADGCVAVTLLDESGSPVGPGDVPAFARFEGVAGHFSTYAVARVVALDSTAPRIAAPAGVVVDAARPNGVPVRYVASARDDLDPAPRLSCVPASGAVFPIGDTTVVCVASDARGNAATARFAVHVRGAAEQIHRLLGRTMKSLSQRALKPAFRAALHRAADRATSKRPHSACRPLGTYVAMVKAAPAHALTAGHRAELVADARRVRAVLGC